MFLNRKIAILATVSLTAGWIFSACSTDTVDDTQLPAPELSGKIANTAQDAQQGVLLVKFDQQAIPLIEEHAAHATRSDAATRSGIHSVDCILDQIGVTSFSRVFPVGKEEERTRAAGLHRWYLLNFAPETDLDLAASMLAGVADISTIQYNTRVYKTYDGTVYPLPDEPLPASRAMTPYPFNDPQLFWQWHYINNGDLAISENAYAGADINAAEAWKLTAGDPRVIVAIVDGGVKHSHPDLAANMWVNLAELNGQPGVDDDNNGYVDDIYGYNFVTDSGQITWNAKGDDSHGTHVAGTVAAVNNNGVGVAGVAGGTGHGDGVRIMSCQIFAGQQDSGDYQTALAIKYAADMGASILQCSYGMTVSYYSDSQFEQVEPLVVDALKYFQSKSNCDAIDGGLVIYASGNYSQPQSSYPGAYRNVISVTAFGVDYLPAYYTNYHLGCNIAAPGGEIVGSVRGGVLSTVCSEVDAAGEDYGYIQGTSMACPHVSGVAALGLSYALKRGKRFTREEFTNMLLTSVNDIDSRMEGVKTTYGTTMDLENDYRGEMGTGAIDAFRLLMQVEGTPCITLARGAEQRIALQEHFGGGSDNLTYIEEGTGSGASPLETFGAEMSAEDMQKLGVAENPRISNGRLVIRCANAGCAKIKIRAIAGGKRVGTGEWIGGIPVVKEIALVVRDTDSKRWM
ncbi:MAG: S8 family serine peptidase [Alistipes sp.]|nr:S8 family serine peptidase [Alistipes sp.]